MIYSINVYIIHYPILIYYYYRFIVRFPIGFHFLFIAFFLHFSLSWSSSLSISSSAMPPSTLSNHVLLGRPTGLLSSTLYSILHTFLHTVFFTFLHHMTIPSQQTDEGDSTLDITQLFFLDSAQAGRKASRI